MRRHTSTAGGKAVAPWKEAVARLCGRVLFAAAVLSLISIPDRDWNGWRIVNALFGLVDIPAEPSLLAVCLLLVLAGAIRRRFRAAHTLLLILMTLNVLAVGLLLVVVLAGDASGLGPTYPSWIISTPAVAVQLVVGVAVLAGVARARRAFPARLARGSRRTSVAVLAAGLAVSFGVTFALTSVFRASLHGVGEEAAWSLRSTFGITTGPGAALVHGHAGPHWIFTFAGLLSAAALVLALLVFWRAGRPQVDQDAADELKVRELLLKYGESDSLGYFATRRDKAVVFSPDGRAAVTFRTEGAVSVASADPIGDPSSWAPAIQAWLEECRSHSRYASVLSASEAGSAEYVRAGLRAFSMGDEAVIYTDRFTLRGRTMRPVRQAVTRIGQAGYTSQVRRHADLTPAELAQVDELAAAWRGDETERGFSMALNRVTDPADGRCVIITAHDRTGAVRGFLSFVPWGVRGISLDLMRRDHQAENGLNEFMVTKLIEASPAMGVRRISLNFAMFRSVFRAADQVGAGPVTRASDAVLGIVSRFYQLETLYRSNQKYQPEWVPRFICYAQPLTVVRAAVAAGTAEGFLPKLGPAFLVGPAVPDAQLPRDEAFNEAVRAQEHALLHPAPPVKRLSEQQRVRRAKLAALERDGFSGYPAAVPRTCSLVDVRRSHEDLAAGAGTGREVSVTGRVRAVRDLGGITFAVLEEDGIALQAMLTAKATPALCRSAWRRGVDLGDLVSVTGEVCASDRGELSVLVREWQLAGKCLNPVPPLRARLTDDVRTRDRALDLITNRSVVDLLTRRSQGVRALREAFEARGYLEVETPMLQAIHGGAAARPFQTHINAYDMDLYLRIAPELYLKRLCVGGMRRIFELNRNFRNEGADASHNPEFTSLEAYEAYGDYTTMRELTREVILAMAVAVNGRPVALRPAAGGGFEEIDLTRPWPVLTVHEAVSRAAGCGVTPGTSRAEVAAVCARHAVRCDPDASAGQLVMALYEALVEKQTVYPTFYCDFPVEVSPLARKHRSDPRLTEQWDLVAFGTELGTAYTELTDPIDQRDRLTRQSIQAAAGDLEAMQLDEPFLSALGYAMPPTGGLGLGVDRLVMILAGVNIRATLAFPFVRPQDAPDPRGPGPVT
ncbi:MAG TPA: bifunctional lysylphosphatidylglycerol synthetase/lysine--tRNA ligase LysX [Streptosporangiaceae bacterium]